MNLQFWPTNLSFFTNSQKFEISQILAIFPKYMIYKDLLYLIQKLWTKIFGTRSKGFDTMGQSKYTRSFYTDIMYLYHINIKKVK